jgi:drug/metabolite transporter (DMT)-like permease
VNSTRSKAYLAWLYIAIIWGTTYYASRVAVREIPPFLMAGTRQVTACVIMMLIAFTLHSKANLSRQNILHNAIIGFLMICIGNGIVTAAVKVIPSSVAALVCSMTPIGVVILNVAFFKAERPGPKVLLGMLLGFAGVAIIFRNDLAALSNPTYLIGIITTLFGTFGWAAGSILSRRWADSTNPMFDAGMQVGFGGLFLLLSSAIAEDHSHVQFVAGPSLWAMGYLIVFGSVLAFTLYRFALKNLPVGFVTSYAYVNPMIAVIIGIFTDEVVSVWTGLSFIAIIGGVLLVNSGYNTKRSSTPKQANSIRQLASDGAN